MDEVIEMAVSLDDRANLAKQSSAEMERLIEDFTPFLYACADKYVTRFDPNQKDEMFSVASVAFYEAILNYEISKGHFFPFANRVISARLIDHLRALTRRSNQTVSLDSVAPSQAQTDILASISARANDEALERLSLEEEIEQYKADLAGWGITMDTLVKQSPKQSKLRKTYKSVVAEICKNPDIIQTIQLKRYLPVTAISKITGIPPKKLDRARTFILASLIIKLGDYEKLSEYVK